MNKKLKEAIYPVKVGKGLKDIGLQNDWYLYQESDMEVLVDYKTKAEAKAAKEIHDWLRKLIEENEK